MRKEYLSLWQIFVLMMTFTIGTAVVVGTGEEAKQDFWIADLIAMLLGAALVFGYYMLLKLGKGKNLYELLVSSFGRITGKLVIFGYVLYFFYIVSRNIRDFGELMRITIMPVTPLEVISISLMIVVTIILGYGVEVLARVTEILIPYFIVSLLATGFFIFISGEMRVNNFQPVLAEGFQPIFNAVFPTRLVFPYGEVIVFTVFLTAVSRFNKVGKVSIMAILTSGLLIVYGDFVQLLTIGIDIKERSLFPLLVAAREISFMEFFERVDSLVVFVLFIGILVKVSVFFYAGLKGLEKIFSVPYQWLVVPVAFLTPLFASVIAGNITSHFEEGLKIVPYLLHLPFQLGIPFVLFIVILVKRKWQMKGLEVQNGENL